MDLQNLYRRIPAVDRLMASPLLEEAASRYARKLVLKAVHLVLDDLRKEIREGRVADAADLTADSLGRRILERLEDLDRPSLRPVINATGVIVHTNLGRSVLAERILERFRDIGGGYSNLEYRLDEGRRGSRYVHVEGILRELTGAEASMVVNNNAAAVLIGLDTLARGREAVVSRGQLVEIGGSFRIPDVMRRSGAVMVEVGTTNKTHLRDYEEVIGPETGVLLRVHRSNFQIVGFTQDVETERLVALGREHGIPVMEDLGSGCLVDFSRYGLTREPTVQEVVSSGVDLLTFSGDKLLGGPQAGILLGREDLIERIRKNPLNRAMRIDKLTLLALEETLRFYRDEESALQHIPTLSMIGMTMERLRSRARGLRRRIGRIDSGNFTLALADGTSKTGGGALPLLDLPTRVLVLVPGRMSAHEIESRLRTGDPPVIARVENERVLLDVRTVQERELPVLARAVKDLATFPLAGDSP